MRRSLRLKSTVVLSLVAALAASNAWAERPTTEPAFHVDVRQTVEFLASDSLEGRMIGTPGIDQASDRIADDFARLGLQPVPKLDGYFQPFTMITRVDPDPAQTRLTLAGHSLKLGEDFVPLRSSAQQSAGGLVVFVGYGIVDPAHKLDEYAGINVKGKIVLAMRFEPHDSKGRSRFAGEDWSADAVIAEKVRTAVEHGAAGVLLVNPPTYHNDDGLISFTRHDTFSATVPVMQVSVAAADDLLKRSGGADLKSRQASIDESLKPASAVLTSSEASLAVKFADTVKQVRNVAAMLPGAGDHADEYVVVGAHYDHLGHGGPGSLAPWSHGIHHGADDNASGTTAMLALADRFAHAGPQKRSIIFIAFTGEEEGLIGSQHFVSNCPVPTRKIVAMLNLDMVGRVSGEKLLIGGEGTAAAFPKMVEDADRGLPLKLGEFGKGGIGPSDHTSFALKRIPVLFFFSGLHLDYHRPTDTADKINYVGMNEVIDLGQRVLTAMTAMPRAEYNGSYDAGGLMQMLGSSTQPAGSSHGGRASLGAIPDYAQGEDAKDGMRIGGIMPGSPADKSGLRQGDVVTRFDDRAIGNMMDYTEALGKAKPGQAVKLQILRGKSPLTVEVTPAARKD